MENLHSFIDRLSPDQLNLYLAFVDEVERYRNLSLEEKKQLVQDIMDRPYLDLLCDWAFKHVFGQNLDLLEMLLRDILQMDLSVEKPLANEIDKFRPDDKNIIMDVVCQLRDGRRIIVEMQQEKKAGFKDRIAYYGAANFVKQLKRGEKYTAVHSVYVVCFVNFKMQHTDCPPDKIVYTYEFREQETGELYGDYISLNFCELPRLGKKSFDRLAPREEWFYLLKNMHNFALNPKGIPERMQKVLEASRTNSLPDEEQLQYFKAMISESEKEDIAVANYQDGYLDGMEKGEAKHAVETAQRMLKKSFDIADIAECSGLTIDQITALSANS